MHPDLHCACLLAPGLALATSASTAQDCAARGWRSVYEEVRASLEEAVAAPDRDDAWLGLWTLHGDLALEGREIAVGRYYVASILGESEEATPDFEERLRLLAEAGSAARAADLPEQAARAANMAARELSSVGRLREARGVLRAALEDLPEARAMRPYLLLELAELERRLGGWAEALARLDELERVLPEGEAAAPLRAAMKAVRAQTHVDFGMPDLSAAAITARWEELEALHEAGRASPEELIDARLMSVHLAKATADHGVAVERIEGFLSDELYAARPADRARLLVLLGTSLLDVEQPDPDLRARGVAILREALSLGPGDALGVYARLALASEALRLRRWDEAQDELDVCRRWARVRHEAVDSATPARELADLATLETRLALDRGDGPERLARLRPELEAAYDALLERWSRVPQRPAGVGFLLYARRRAVLGELIRLTLALDGDEAGARRAFDLLMRLQLQGTLAKRMGATAPTVEDVRARFLRDGHGLLVFLPADAASYVVALDRERLVVATLAAGAELDAMQRRYFALLHAADRDLEDGQERAWLVSEERRQARALCEGLLPPAVRTLVAKWQRMSVVGLDSLGPVPFEWLLEEDEARLGARVAIDYLPSVPVGTTIAREAVSSSERIEIIGGVRPAAAVVERWPRLVPLPVPESLRRTVERVHASRSPRFVEGLQAVPSHLRGAGISGVRLLQLFVHGVQDLRRERPAALVLQPEDGSPDGLIACADVEALTAPPYVLLTACRSGRGPERRGDAAVGDLGGAWLLAGARAVVVFQTDLSVAEATRVSCVLHERLAAGDSLAEALRSLRRDLLEEDPETAPFRQGLIAVVGLGQEPVFPEPIAPSGGASPKEEGDGRWPSWGSALLGVVVGLVAGVALARRSSSRPPLRSEG